MIGKLVLLFFVFLGLGYCTVFAQTVTVAPSGTVITQTPSTANAFAMGSGQTYTVSNTAWPNFYTPCYTFGLNDTLFNVINGNNNQPTGGPCSGLSNLVYNPGSSNLGAGIIVYTGTTTYKYLNTGSTYTTNNAIQVRATVTFSQPVTYYSNNTFIIPVTGNFNYHVLYESFSPTNAQYYSGSSNQWTPSVDLFNNLHTDPATSICVDFTGGKFYLNTVTSITTSSGAYCSGTTINLTGGGIGNNLTYTWNGPNTYYSSGANGTIFNASISNSGQYIFTATSDIGCVDTSHVQITVNQPPVATAGGTIVVCHTANATVTGANASNGTISWTHNGNGSLMNGNTLSPIYDPAPSDAGNTVVLTLHVTSNNACAPAQATATFNVIVQGTPIATDGATTSGCSTSNIPITTATATFGTIQWTHNGTGTLTNGTTSTPIYTPGPGDDGNTIILTVTVTSTNSCAPGTATAYHFINITPLPQAVAGGTTTICSNSTATVTGATANYGTISWSHNGTGTLANPTTLTPTYTPSPGDIGNIVSLTMTVTSNNACNPAFATADFTINVVGAPIAVCSGTSTICSNSPLTISGASAQNGTISWSHNGNGIISNNTSTSPTYTPSPLDAGNTVVLTMIVTSNNSCAPQTSSASYTINVNHLPQATCTGTAVICQNDIFQINTAGAAYGTILWTTNGNGTITNNNTLTPIYNAATLDAGNIVTLTMTVTSNNACAPQTSSATFNITIQKLPVAIAGGTTVVCLSNNAPVAGVTATNGSIVWTHNGQGNLLNSTSTGPTYQPNVNDVGDTITLTLNVISTNACAPQIATASYSIIVDSLPLAFAGGNSYICVNSNTTIVNAVALYGNPSWTTTGIGTLSNANTINPTYTPAPSEQGTDVTLTLNVSSNNSCAPSSNQSLLILHIDSLPIAQTMLYDTICPGGNYPITGSFASNGTVSWSHNGGGSIINGNTLFPTYVGVSGDAGNTILFTLTVTSENSCNPQTATSTLQVYVENSTNAPIIILDSIHNASCNSLSDGEIFISVINGSQPFTYTWQPSGDTTQDIHNLPANTYTVLVMDSHGCSDQQSYEVKQPDSLEILGTIVPVDCSGLFGSINTVVTGGTPIYHYSWLPNNDTLANVTGLTVGLHSLTVTDNHGCSLTADFQVNAVGNLIVSATPNSANVNIGTPTTISVTGAENYIWNPTTYLNCDTCSTVICTPFESGTYVVTGTTPNGCVGTDTVQINMYIDCSNICIPSMFSPDDNGPVENNTFGILGQYPCIADYQLMIFNRWGEMVFETIDYKVQWDGTYQGQALNSGVFVYRLTYKTIEGNEFKKSGNITLVR